MIKTEYNGDCVDIHRYEDILFTFPMRKFHETYHAEGHGTCYKNAVFGYLTGNDGYKLTVEANQHIFKGRPMFYIMRHFENSKWHEYVLFISDNFLGYDSYIICAKISEGMVVNNNIFLSGLKKSRKLTDDYLYGYYIYCIAS